MLFAYLHYFVAFYMVYVFCHFSFATLYDTANVIFHIITWYHIWEWYTLMYKIYKPLVVFSLSKTHLS